MYSCKCFRTKKVVFVIKTSWNQILKIITQVFHTNHNILFTFIRQKIKLNVIKVDLMYVYIIVLLSYSYLIEIFKKFDFDYSLNIFKI